ncbi:MAG TPA: TraR/DksA family transcriptional regulator [Dehalococcoidia bacterium]|nr:TraR/DksA family transcriptional regulator [Dehalococcoidia bacterium]
MEAQMSTDYSELRKKLKSEQKRLEEELEQIHTSASSSDERREGSPFGKREEEATETLELEKRLTMENRIRQELVGIEHALRKFDEGTYGKCDNCGKSIAKARLEALPQASLCLDCKSQQAKNAKGKPSPG